MSEQLLEIKNLTVQFPAGSGFVHAVNGVDLSIRKGEVLGIVGESGCGKSVSLFSILGLLPPQAKVQGEILFEGKNLLALSTKELQEIRGKEISMIFQEPMTSLNPVFKVGGQIAEAIMLHEKLDRKAARQKALELLERVEVPDAEKRLDCYPYQLSGGLRQRVMIAMALACRPKILLADEPTTALDVTIQDQILKQLRELKKEYGTSIIFITHDLGVVAELCDRVVVLYGGLVMEEASIFDIFEHPSHPYTLGLLASIPSLDQDKSRRLLPIPGSPPDMTKPPLGCPFAPRCPYARVICGQSLPEMRALSKDHKSRCWLLEPDAPSEHNPFSREEGTKNE